MFGHTRSVNQVVVTEEARPKDDPRPVGLVEGLLEQHESQIHMAHEALSRLSQRINPVLRPEPPVGTATGADNNAKPKPIAGSELTEILRHQIAGLAELIERTDQLTSRVEF